MDFKTYPDIRLKIRYKHLAKRCCWDCVQQPNLTALLCIRVKESVGGVWAHGDVTEQRRLLVLIRLSPIDPLAYLPRPAIH